MKDVNEAVSFIHSISWKKAAPGLSRTRELLGKMGNPQNSLKFIHIVGTNGKGSTAAMLSSILRSAGYRTGLFTSPFIMRFNERMMVDGKEIEDNELVEITELVKPAAESCSATPTEFELVTCIAMEYFKRHCCDIVVLEAGLGGAFDSTNVIDVPECAVICNIGFDHTEILGNTLLEIAETKAGIFKTGGTCVTYPAVPEVEALYDRITLERNLDLHRADFSELIPVSSSLEGQLFDWKNLKNLKLSLIGTNQLHNAAVVLTVIECLNNKGRNITEEAVRAGLSRVSWPGRFEILHRNPIVISDGGHNPQCIASIAENIRAYLPGKKIVFVMGVMADKDYLSMYRTLAPYASHFITVTAPCVRALSAADFAAAINQDILKTNTDSFDGSEFSSITVISADSVEAALCKAIRLSGEDGAVIACGSLYMVGDVRRYFKKDILPHA